MAERETVQRRLAAILAADVVGYSRMMSADEENTRRLFNAYFNDLMVPAITSRGGRIFKTLGDGLLAEFNSVVEAVGCAEAVQASLLDRNAERPAGERFEFRMAVNLGDVIVEGDDIHGDGVNIAARLESAAEPGTIYITQEVYQHVSGKLTFKAVPVGETRLKNIDRAIDVFRLEPSHAETGDRFHTGVQRPPAGADRPSLAVLPFHNRSGNSEDDYFAEGIAEDILSSLSHFGWLFVIARSTSFVFTARDRDPRTIASQLGVSYILDGSVRRSGNRVRISAELAECATGKQIWTARYDRDLTDIFDVQDEISERITGEIQPELARSEQDRARKKKREQLRVWDIHQQAMWHSWRRTEEDLRQAVELFDAALSEDAGFVDALAGEAEALCYLFIRGFSRDDENVLEKACSLARKAVELEPADAQSHYALGRTLMFMRRHDEAEPELRKALEINPNHAHALFAYGNTLATAGRAGDGIPYLERAMRLSPRDHQIGQMMTRLAESMLFVGRNDEALEWARRSLQQPNIQPSRWTTLLAILGTLGRVDEARPVLEALRTLDRRHTIDFIRTRYPIVDDGYMSILVDGLERAGLT